MKSCIECKKQDVSEKYRPFCSKRCADIDLHRWATQSYALPTEDSEGMAMDFDLQE